MNAQLSGTVRHQRSHGVAGVALCRLRGATRLTQLRQQGSAKAILPQLGTRGGEAVPEVVFLNTSGGLTSGDRLSYAIDLGPGCRAVGTTQTAERAYRADQGPAVVDVHHRVAAGSHLDWLPQETILFDRSALNRRTRIDLAADAGCLVLEAVVLGRAAMGERLSDLRFADRREIWRQGRPVLIEPLVLSGAALGAGPAVLDGARAFASLALVGRGAEDALAATRAVLDQPGVTAAASGFDGRLVVRLMAAEGWPLRCQILRVLAVLRQVPVPRVWQM